MAAAAAATAALQLTPDRLAAALGDCLQRGDRLSLTTCSYMRSRLACSYIDHRDRSLSKQLHA